MGVEQETALLGGKVVTITIPSIDGADNYTLNMKNSADFVYSLPFHTLDSLKNHFVLTPKWFFHHFHGELDCRFLLSNMLNFNLRKAM